MLSQDFIFDGCTILVHGFSRVVLQILKLAAQNNKLFRVFCTGSALSKAIFFVVMKYEAQTLLCDTSLRVSVLDTYIGLDTTYP